MAIYRESRSPLEASPDGYVSENNPPPIDPGLRAMQTSCTVCHTVARIQAKNLSMDDWQMLIDDMKGKGAILRGNDEALLLEYLVKNYGPK